MIKDEKQSNLQSAREFQGALTPSQERRPASRQMIQIIIFQFVMNAPNTPSFQSHQILIKTTTIHSNPLLS